MVLYVLSTSRWLPYATIPKSFLFYPASAVAIALVVILGWRGLVGVLVGSLAVNLKQGMPWPTSGAMVAVQVAEPLLVAFLLQRLAPWQAPLRKSKGIFVLFATAVPVNLLLSALPGPTILQWAGPIGRFADPLQSRLNWFMADIAGILCLTPFLVIVLQPPIRRWIRRPLAHAAPFAPVLSTRPIAEGLALSLATLCLVGATFSTHLLPVDWRWPLRFACFLPATWAALRLGLRGAAALCAVLPVSATLFFWLAPWGLVSVAEFRSYQLILILAAFTSMVVGATVEENRSLTMKYQNLVEESDHGILRVDPEGRILDANRTVRELTGRGLKGLQLRPLEDFLVPPGEGASEERTLLAADGSLVPVQVHASILPDGTSQVSILDLRSAKVEAAARMELEEHLHESQKMEAVATLAGGIAHEFNNLLTVILANAERIEAEGGLPPECATRLGAISQAVQRATHVTRQLMAYSMVDRGAPCPMDPMLILQEALLLLKTTMDPRVQVRTEVASSSPQVQMDPSHLKQIILNLAFNAQEAMPDGGTLTLRLAGLQVDDHLTPGNPEVKPGTFLVLVVQDSGRGMDPCTQARAFDPFFTTKEVGKGPGLGLSSVKGLVKLYGGWTHLDSQVGVGTTIRVYLPAVSTPEGPSQAQEPPALAPTRTQRRILLVDDEVFIRDVAREILEGHGFAVTEAADGEEGLTRFLDTPDGFDLVILDLVMPRMHGFQVMNRIRQVAPRVPILISSGYSQDTRPDLLQPSTTVGFLAKPYRSRALLDHVERLMGGAEEAS